MGVTVRDTTSDTKTATDKVTANSLNSRPTIPPISRIGMNTATSDKLIDSTVKLTSRAPCMAALSGVMPSSMCREIFSSITTASSTTNPAPTVMAISEMLFRLKPAKYITPKVPTNEIATAALGIRAALKLRKKTNTTSITKAIEISSVCSTSLKEVRMVGVRSDTTDRVIAAGMEARSCGKSFITWSTVSIILAPA